MKQADFLAFVRTLARPAIAFAIPLAVTVVFSMFQFPIRGYRNLGIAGCYLVPIVSFFKFGWRRTVAVWIALGVASGLLYFTYEVATWLTHDGPHRQAPSVSIVFDGLIAWPIMAPEAIEYTLAELGLLGPQPSSDATERKPNPARVQDLKTSTRTSTAADTHE